MTTSFIIEAMDGRELEVQVLVECRDRDGADMTYDIESVWVNGTGDEVLWTALTEADHVRINAKAERVAEESACDAYQSYAEGQADAAYDAWKDEQMERGE